MAKKNSSVINYIKLLGDNVSIVADGTVYDNVDYIDTGCYMLNAQLSNSIYGGIRSNKITGLAGEESTGKTFLLLGLIKNYLDKNKKAYVVFFESEGAVDKKTFEDRDIDSNRVIMKTVETVEEFRNKVTKLLNAYKKDKNEDKPKMLFCLDSLGMLPSEKENDDAEKGTNKVDMTRAKVIKSLFRTITIKLALNNIPLIFTNHVYDSMDKYSLPEFSGGKGSKFSASTLLYLAKSQFKEEDGQTHEEEHSGITVASHTIKSRDTRQKTKVKFIIHVKYGLSKFSGLLDFCKVFGLVSKQGNRWYWTSDGEENSEVLFQKAINKNPSNFFTKERLDEIDIECKKYFGYGNDKKPEEDEELDGSDIEDIINEIEGVEDDTKKELNERPKRKSNKKEKSKTKSKKTQSK